MTVTSAARSILKRFSLVFNFNIPMTSLLLLLWLLFSIRDCNGNTSPPIYIDIPLPSVLSSYKKVLLQGTRLQSYETGHAAGSPLECARKCLRRMTTSSPNCQAFDFHPLDRTCDFYTYGRTFVDSSNVQVFEFQDGGKRYHSILVSSEYLDYSAGRKFCNDAGGYLLEFDSQSEHDAVKQVVASGYYKVGANDIDIEGQWVTDREGKPLDTSLWRWGSGHPYTDITTKDCALYKPSLGKLYDSPCTQSDLVLCERDVP